MNPISPPLTFVGLVFLVIDFIQKIGIPLIFTVALLFALWKIVDVWILHGGDRTKVEEGKKTIFSIVVVLAIMSAVWGIVALLRTSLTG